jgi:uncharacterized membrane protein YraQ (UPF0718 family)
MKFKDKLKRVPKSWYFLIAIILIYIIISVFNKGLYIESISFFGEIIYKVIPIFILVFVLMTLSNYFVTPEFIMKHLGDKGIKKWFFVIIGGILSSGPIYMWYPLLADLKNRGLSNGLIACFLYNRAIKIPLIPLAIVYFSWQYILVLMIVMIVMSVVQGMLLNKLMEVEK